MIRTVQAIIIRTIVAGFPWGFKSPETRTFVSMTMISFMNHLISDFMNFFINIR